MTMSFAFGQEVEACAMINIPKYELVSTAQRLCKILQDNQDKPLALDFETTSLKPADGRARLVSLSNDTTSVLVDFDPIKGGFRSMAEHFTGTYIVFNAGFEGRWFLDAGHLPTLWDVGYMRRSYLGGGRFRLMDMVAWDLKIEMSKEQQLSDWSAPILSQEQVDYAYLDAHLTWELYRYWTDKMDDQHWLGFHMLNDMYPAVIEMEDSGILMDQAYHKAELITNWTEVRDTLITTIREFVGADEVSNINSDPQWSDYFARTMQDDWLDVWPRTEKSGRLQMTTKTLKLLAGKCPGTPLEEFFDALSGYKTMSKYLSSFGQSMIDAANKHDDGRIRARFNIGAAKTCRFSSSGPNLQQVPRDKELLGKATSVRRSLVAGRGNLLASLDYSGIELRVLALLTGDEQLLEDMVTGDVHAEVAAVIAGHKIDKTTKDGKAARTAAKGVSFGIIYGSGAAGLAGTMRTSVGRAQGYIDFWQHRYPKAFQLRHDIMDEVTATKFIRMVDGGTVYMAKPDLPKCANYPVQRAALSIMAKAISRHKASLDSERAAGRHTGTRMIATIHDALIDEVSSLDAQSCLQMMEQDMIGGYLDVFPGAPIDNLVEGGVGPNWAELD